jgi:hypothetical protein
MLAVMQNDKSINLSFMKSIISLLFPNKKNFEEFLNRANYKIIYLIPIMLGLTMGIMHTEIRYWGNDF